MSHVHPQQERAAEVGRLRKEAGQILKGMREQAGLTQRQLAEKVGIDYYTFVAQLEAGRGRIPPERYEAFASALNMPKHDFVKKMMRYYDPFTYESLFGEAKTI